MFWRGGVKKVSNTIDRIEDDWQVSFADTGSGMTPQQTEKIFEPFQSNFEGGTGLGLAVVYQIVQAHEGRVWARSKPGQGATFVLRLRRLDADRLDAARSETSRSETGKTETNRSGADRSTSTRVVEQSAVAKVPAPAQLAAVAAEGRVHG